MKKNKSKKRGGWSSGLPKLSAKRQKLLINRVVKKAKACETAEQSPNEDVVFGTFGNRRLRYLTARKIG